MVVVLVWSGLDPWPKTEQRYSCVWPCASNIIMTGVIVIMANHNQPSGNEFRETEA